MRSERFNEPVELTEESLERILEVRVSAGTRWEVIKTNIESGLFIRFAVSNDHDIFVAPGSHTHEGLLEDNGLEWKDCMITNGLLKENDDGSLVFVYHSTSRSILHNAVEKKILKFFEENTGIKLTSRSISSVYSTD